MICLPSLCLGQGSPSGSKFEFADTVRIVRKNGDGSYVVEINGQNFRALTLEQLDATDRAFTACRKDAALADQEIAKYQQLQELYKRDVTIANQQVEIEQGIAKAEHLNFTRAIAMYEKEKELRTTAQQFIPHGQARGLWGGVLRFLDSPAGQATFKLVIPTAQAIKVFARN